MCSAQGCGTHFPPLHSPDRHCEPEVHAGDASGRVQVAQFSTTRAPEIWAWLTQPRPAERRATKSNISCTSTPDSCILVIALSNGKMLNISSIVTGPGTMSVRMPVVFVSEKSVCTPRRRCIAVAIMLPSGESPPAVPKRLEPSGA